MNKQKSANERVFDILKRLDYLVWLRTNEDGKSCTVTFPNKEAVTYKIDGDSLTINDEVKKLPNYVSRLLIRIDVVGRAIKLKYDKSLIFFSRGDKLIYDTNFIDIDEPDKEIIVSGLLDNCNNTAALPQILHLAEANGVDEGFAYILRHTMKQMHEKV